MARFDKMMDGAYKMLGRGFTEEIMAPDGFSRENLALWNKVQYEVWKDVITEFGYDRNDAKLFGKFGVFFYEYWGKNRKIPEAKDFEVYVRKA